MARQGLERGFDPVDLSEGLKQLQAAEFDRSVKFEGMLFLADTATIKAAHLLNDALWRLEAIASGRVEVDEEAWIVAFRAYRSARSNLYGPARKSMGVPAADTSLPLWRVAGHPGPAGVMASEA